VYDGACQIERSGKSPTRHIEGKHHLYLNSLGKIVLDERDVNDRRNRGVDH